MAAEATAHLESLESDGGLRLVPRGPWTLLSAARLEPEIERVVSSTHGPVVLDLSDIDHIDTAGGWLLTRLEREIEGKGVGVTVEGGSENVMRLLEALKSADRDPPKSPKPTPFGLAFLEGIGRVIYGAADDAMAGLNILGGVTAGFVKALRHPSRFRITSVVFHIERTGLQAVPIIALMSLLIGAIIAQQSAFQLRPFGAEVYVVDLVGVLVLRELGVLLTAIMIAGRSGSAFTAEIGSMKMREEIDALDVIGLDVNEVLVLPRILALIIALPLLTIIADFAALLGGGIVSWLYVGLPPYAFIARLRDAVYVSTFWVGIIKAPFMALIIGIIAANEGFRVQGSAESLGARTTSSVVKAIFMVIVVDGFFAMYFSAVSY